MNHRFFTSIQPTSGFRFVFLAAGFLFVFLLSARAQTPLAHYPLDGNANDAGSNGLNGTIVGTLSPVTDRFGNPNSAMRFDGTTANRIEIADNPLLRPTNITLMAWVKINSQNALSTFIGKPLSPCINDSWHFGTEAGNYSAWISNSTGCGDFVQTVSPLSVGTWRHLAYTVDVVNDVRVLYVDGVPVAQGNFTSNLQYDGNPVFLGANLENGALAFPLNGDLDEVKIFGSALTPGQIRLEAGTAAPTGLIAHYPFTGNANDAIGSLNGTINGATLTFDRFGNPNSAYSFDGVDDFINTPTLALTQTDNWSITTWVNASSISGTPMIVQNGFDDGVSACGGYTLGLHEGFVGGYLPCVAPLITISPIPANQWVFLSMVRESGVTKFYINGIQSATTFSQAPNTPFGALTIGSASGIRFFNGAIDEVKIYNTALTANQIQEQLQQEVNHGNQFGNSLQLTTQGDFVSIPNSPILNIAQNVTVESWVKIEQSLSGEKQVFINSIAPDNWGYFLAIMGSQPTFGVVVGGGQTNVTSPDPIALNEWVHIAGIREGNSIKILVNGVVKATASVGSGDLRSGTGIHKIGQAQSSGSNFIGFIDELRVWNVARTQEQIFSTINQPLTGNESGLIAYWDMNRNGQGSNLTLVNKASSSGNAIDGTTQGTALTPIFTEGSAQQKPGSGNALLLDGIDDEVTTTGKLVPTTGDFTVEFWVKNSSNTGFREFISQGSSGDAFYLGLDNSGTGSMRAGDAWISTGVVLPLNEWTHISFVKTGSNAAIFKNGILASTTANYSISSGGSNTAIGRQYGGLAEFANANMDELRIWNTALSQSQIRDRMCRKITSADALFGNLVAYYNFDEPSGNTVFDGTANANNGTLLNGPTRVTSGAAIGNASAHHYVTSGLPSANLSVNGQDNLAIAYTSGTFSGEAGTHVYAVSEKPNTENGIEGAGTNNRYFGVFHAGLTNPQYTATYNYNGNPFVSGSNEGQLALFKRNDNASSTWTNAGATLNTSAKTLTVSGQSTEYVLGSIPCTAPPTPTISAGGPTSFCTGDSVTLTSSSASGNLWSNGATTPSIKVKTAGTFTVQVVLAGCSSAVSAAVGVEVSPISIAGFSPATAFTGDSVTVSLSCPLFISQVLVNGENVGPFRAFGNQIRFAIGSGISTGKIRLVHTGGMVETVENLLVNPLPSITGFSPVSGLPGTLVTLTGQHFLGISTVKLGNQSVVFTVVNSTQITFNVPSGALTGIISLTGTTGTGTSASSFVVCPVLSPPTVSGNGGCGPASFLIQASGGGGDNFNWYTASSGGAPVFSGQTFSPFLASSATFFVSSTSDNGFCENSVRTPITLTVFPRPEAPFLLNDTLCSAGLATLSANSSAPEVSYKWFNEGVLIPGETASSLSLFVNQTRQISVQAVSNFQNGNCESVISNGLALLTAFSEILPDSATICPDSTRSIGLKTGGLPFESFLWFNGSTQSFTSINAPGTYSIRQFRFGCEKRDTVKITPGNDAPIGVFTRVTPSENQIDIDFESVIFSWDPAPQAKGYRLYVWPENQARPALASVETDGINATIQGLSPNTRFNWQVQAFNDCHVLWGDTGVFFSKGLADLRVSNLQASTTAIAGQRIAITYTVTNIGMASTDFHSWKDHFFISNEKQINVANLSFADQENAILYGLGEKTNPGFLLPGQSYTRTVEFPLKSNVIGPRFVVVLVNNIGFTCDSLIGDSCAKNFSPLGGTLKEARFTNNSASSSLQIQDVLRPDLTITNIGIAQSVFGGSVPNLGYSIKNIGFATAKGIPIQSFPDEIPNSISIPIVRGSNFFYQPEGLLLCDESAWKDRIYVSPDSVFDESNATLLKEVLVRPRFIRAGNVRCFDVEQATLAGITKTVPPNPAWFGVSDEIAIDSTLNVNVVVGIPHNLFGPTFLHVVTNFNGTVKEASSQVNNVKTVKVNVNLAPPADLSVQNLVVPNLGASGKPIQIQYRVRNVGANSPKPSETVWNDSIFISRSSIFNRDSCKVLGVFNTAQGDTLLPGRFYTRTGEFKVPDGISGNWFVHVISDANNRVFEFTFNSNNLASSPAISINPTPSPDIEPLDFQFPADWFSLENTQVKLKIRNNGPGTAFGPWENTVFIAENIFGKNTMASVSAVFPAGDSIQAGAQKELVFSFSGLNVTGNVASNLFVIANATGSLYENGQVANNRKTMGSFTLKPSRLPVSPSVSMDLVLEDFSVSGSAFSGEAINISYQTKNLAGSATGNRTWADGIFLSLDNQLDPGDQILTSFCQNSPNLGVDSLQQRSGTVQLPVGISGNRFLILVLDKGISLPDPNRSNNQLSLPVSIALTPPADLRITQFEPIGETRAGELLKVKYTITNSGTGALFSSGQASLPWGIGLFLNTSARPGGRQVKFQPVSAPMLPGQSFSDTVEFFVPNSALGTYFLVAEVDNGNRVFELNELNNVFSPASTINILPAIPNDLALTRFTAPISGISGEMGVFNFSVKNVGTRAVAGNLRNVIQFSDQGNNLLSALAPIQIQLQPGDSLEQTFSSQLPAVLPGKKKPKGRINANQSISETDFGNNEKLSEDSISLDVNALTLNVQRSILLGQARKMYFKVNPGIGADLVVTLTSPLDFGSSDVYISHNRIPTVSDFDISSGNLPAPSRQVLVPQTKGGTYFILVQSQNAESVNHELLARALPFSILGIAPSVLGNGVVSTTLSGAGFRDSMRVELRHPSTNELVATARTLSFTSSMSNRLKWNLKDVSPGEYNVVATNTNGESQILANGVRVEPATIPAVQFIPIAPAQIRARRTGTFSFSYRNISNVDIPVFLSDVFSLKEAKVIDVKVLTGELLKNSQINPNWKDFAEEEGFVHVSLLKRNFHPGEQVSFQITYDFKDYKLFNFKPVPRALGGSSQALLRLIVNPIEILRNGILANPDAFDFTSNPVFLEKAPMRNDFHNLYLSEYFKIGVLSPEDTIGFSGPCLTCLFEQDELPSLPQPGQIDFDPARLGDTATTSTPQIFAPGSTLNWEINDYIGRPGAAAGSDLIHTSGQLQVKATVDNRMIINILSRGISGQPGGLASWYPAVDKVWPIVIADQGIQNFDPNKFILNVDGFTRFNNIYGGSFSIEKRGTDTIALRFTSFKPGIGQDGVPGAPGIAPGRPGSPGGNGGPGAPGIAAGNGGNGGPGGPNAPGGKGGDGGVGSSEVVNGQVVFTSNGGNGGKGGTGGTNGGKGGDGGNGGAGLIGGNGGDGGNGGGLNGGGGTGGNGGFGGGIGGNGGSSVSGPGGAGGSGGNLLGTLANSASISAENSPSASAGSGSGGNGGGGSPGGPGGPGGSGGGSFGSPGNTNPNNGENGCSPEDIDARCHAYDSHVDAVTDGLGVFTDALLEANKDGIPKPSDFKRAASKGVVKALFKASKLVSNAETACQKFAIKSVESMFDVPEIGALFATSAVAPPVAIVATKEALIVTAQMLAGGVNCLAQATGNEPSSEIQGFSDLLDCFKGLDPISIGLSQTNCLLKFGNCATILSSCDPNEIQGPQGFGEDKMVSKSAVLPFKVLFENDSLLASNSAEKVSVSVPVHPNINPLSIRLGEFGFRNMRFQFPPNQAVFNTILNLEDSLGFNVELTAGVDVVGKRFFWNFQTLDPRTGLPPTDGGTGFLPINNAKGDGEGFVTYTVLANEEVETGDSLQAQAFIIFDENTPIITNVHQNRVDARPPSTSLKPIPATVDSLITLSLQGSDDPGGSGLNEFAIFASENGGAFTAIAAALPSDTTILFKGKPGAAYCFFSQARDNVNQEEALKASGETCTQVRIFVQDSIFVSQPAQSQVFCSGDTLPIRWTSTTSGLISLYYKSSPQSDLVEIANGISAQNLALDWANAGLSATSSAQVWIVSGTDTSRSGTFSVLSPPKPVVSSSGPLNFCQGDSVILSSSVITSNLWSNGATSQSIKVKVSGSFSVKSIVESCTSSVSDPITVTVNPLPVVNAGSDVSIEVGQTTTLSASGAASYQWAPLTALSPANGVGASVVASPVQTTLYTVTGTDANNCSNTDQVLVTVTGVSGPLTAPLISPVTGTYDGPQTVTLTSTSPGAEIYYTTSGNLPVIGTGFTKLYTGPFQVLQSTTVRAMAVKSGQANSPVAVSILTISNPGICAAPVVNPGSGTFSGSVTISLSSSTPNAQIWYTTNGNSPRIDVPNSFTKLFTGPFVLFGSATVRAMSARSGLLNSPVTLANFVISNPAVVEAPAFSPTPGNYGSPQTIALSSSTPGAQIYFTNNGITPSNTTPAARLYTGPFVLSQSGQIKAIAYKEGLLPSVVSVGNYSIGPARVGFEDVGSAFYFEGEDSGKLASGKELKLVPNPNQGRFFIQLDAADETAQIAVFNHLGQTIWEGKMPAGQTQLEIDISGHASGIYLLRYSGPGLKKEIRITKF